MAETSNYGLYITEAADNPTFKDWREKMAAAGDSNMEKIDEALKELSDGLGSKGVIRQW